MLERLEKDLNFTELSVFHICIDLCPHTIFELQSFLQNIFDKDHRHALF